MGQARVTGLVAGLLAAACPAIASPQCAQRSMVMNAITQKYGETRRGMGIASDQTMMEMFANAETGSWTLTLTLPTGITCSVMSGENYEDVIEKLPPAGTVN